METELNHLTANLAELEAENNKLRAELAELKELSSHPVAAKLYLSLKKRFSDIDHERVQAQEELAELRARVSEPVAWMHNKRVDVIHTSVKSLLSDFAVNSGPESMLMPIDKSEHYTIPLYAAPVPAQPAADVAAIAKAVRDIPSRIESLGGQRFAYVKLSEVIDTIYSMAGKHPAVPDDVAKDAMLIYEKALVKLATLGNEPLLGNSSGNVIAQDALAQAAAILAAKENKP